MSYKERKAFSVDHRNVSAFIETRLHLRSGR